MEDLEKKDPGLQYNFRNLMIGLVLIIISTYFFISRFSTYTPGNLFKQSVGIFLCVAFFTMGIMIVFSSLTIKNRMIYLVTPFVVFLGTLFVLTFIHLSGIAQIVTTYPQLQVSKTENQIRLKNARLKINELQQQNSRLQSLLYLQKAHQDFVDGKRLDAVLDELRMAATSLKESQHKVLLKRVNTLIGHLEKLPTNVNEEFNEIEELLLRRMSRLN